MADYSRPGSYVEETYFGSKPATGTATSVSGFVGVTQKGSITNAIECNSWNEFVTKCGERLSAYALGHSVYGFFNNGGKKAYISRVTHYSGSTSTAVCASVTLQDRTNTQDVLVVNGLTEGTWAEDLTVSIEGAAGDLASFSYLRNYDASTGVFVDDDAKGKYENIYSVIQYNGSAFTDKTSVARAEDPTPYTAFSAIGDYLAIGAKYGTFSHITISTGTNTTVATGIVALEYWNGLGWQSITPTTDDLGLSSAGALSGAAIENNDIIFTKPTDWKKCEVNGTLAYWVRLRVTTAYTVADPLVKKIQITPPSSGADRQFEPFPAAIAVGDAFYVGSINTLFDALETDVQVLSAGGTPVNAVEYWNGNTWKALTVTEGTTGVKNFTVSGTLSWTAPTDWARTTVNSNIAYWIRFVVTTAPTSTNPVLYAVLSNGSKFKMLVKENGIQVESFDNLSMDSTNKNYVESRINTDTAKSKYIKVTIATGITVADTRPELIVDAPLVSGNDGLTSLADTDYIGSSTLKTGLYRFDSKSDLRFIAIPDKAGNADVMGAGITYAETRKDCYFFVDTEYGKTAAEIKDWKQLGGNFNSSYAGMYWPWGKVVDPSGSGDNPRKWIPPSGHVMGIGARIHQQYGVGQAIAGDIANVRGFLTLEREVTNEDIELLNPVGVNCIASFEDLGIVVWGGRNLITSDNTLTYQQTRLLIEYIRNSMLKYTRFAPFKPNNSTLWKKLYNIGYDLLDGLWRSGALYDGGTGQAKNAFFVVCDSSLNTRESVNAGKVYMQLGFCITKPAEFIVLSIGQWDGGNIVEEAIVNGSTGY